MSKQTVEFDTSFSAEKNTWDDSSITPVQDGEEVSAEVLNRPHQALRRRTETLRKEVSLLKYLIDSDRALLFDCRNPITATQASGGGLIFSIGGTGTAAVRPYLAPGSASVTAYVDIGTATAGTHLRVRTTSSLRSYGSADAPTTTAGANDYTLTVVYGAVRSLVLADTEPQRDLTVTLLETDVVSSAVAYMNAQFLSQGLPFTVTAMSESSSVDTAAVISTLAKTSFKGAYEVERHEFTNGALITLFTDTNNHLLDGDTLAISYASIVSESVLEGRRQSISDYAGAVFNVDQNLVNLRTSPDKIPYAIPLCVRAGDYLVFLDGTRIRKNSTVVPGESLTRDGGSVDGSIDVADDVTVGGDVAVTGDVSAATFTSTVVGNKSGTGTAPMTVASSKVVTNLNTDYLRGNTWDEPEDIGLTTPAKGKFTDLTATGALTVDGAADITDTLTVDNPDSTEVSVIVKTNSAGGANIQEWRPNGIVKAAVGNTGIVKTDAVDSLSGPLELGANATSVTVGGVGTTTTIPGALSVSGGMTFNDKITVDADSAGDTPLTVKGDSAQTADLQQWLKGATVSASVDKDGQLLTKGADTLDTGTTLTVGGTTAAGVEIGRAAKTTTIKGPASLSDTLSVATGKATTLGGTLGVTGATTLSDTLGVTGATTLSDTLTVAAGKTTTLNGPLVAASGATVTGLTVAKGATAADVPLTARKNTGTSGNIQEWYNQASAGTAVAWVDYTGKIKGSGLELTNALAVGYGGTGRQTLTLNNILLGNDTTQVKLLAPGTSGWILTSDGNIPKWSDPTSLTIGNASTLLGGTWASPGARLGGTTAHEATFTARTNNPTVSITGPTIDNKAALYVKHGGNSNTVATVLVEAASGQTSALQKWYSGTTVYGVVDSRGFVGDLVGDVTGNVTGNVTGDVTGDVTGTASNASKLVGSTWSIPGDIGSVTPKTGKFTTLTCSTLAVANYDYFVGGYASETPVVLAEGVTLLDIRGTGTLGITIRRLFNFTEGAFYAYVAQVSVLANPGQANYPQLLTARVAGENCTTTVYGDTTYQLSGDDVFGYLTQYLSPTWCLAGSISDTGETTRVWLEIELGQKTPAANSASLTAVNISASIQIIRILRP